MIICLECKKKFKIISSNHLKYKHNMTIKHYLKKYPDCETGYDSMCYIQSRTNLKRYGVKNVSFLDSVKKKIVEKNTGIKKSKISRLKMSKSHTGKVLTERHKNNISNSSKYSLEYIDKKYKFFLKTEEMRYNPDKFGEKEIQVHCKNHLCENSKERGGWFIPEPSQIWERLRQFNTGNDGSYFYCSEECKNKCSLYNLRPDYILNIKQTEKLHTQSEYQTFREFVLSRDKYKCQYCGKKADHVHHERPQKLEPFFALDPDFAWSVCKKCHYEKGHKDECSTGNLAKLSCS